MAQQSDCALHIVLVGQRPVKSHKIAQDRTKTLVDGVVHMDYWRNGLVELRPQSGAFLLRSMSKLLDVNKFGRAPSSAPLRVHNGSSPQSIMQHKILSSRSYKFL